jgi:hypothetical protein
MNSSAAFDPVSTLKPPVKRHSQGAVCQRYGLTTRNTAEPKRVQNSKGETVSVTKKHTMEAEWEPAGKSLCILDFSTTWSAVSFKLLSLYPRQDLSTGSAPVTQTGRGRKEKKTVQSWYFSL